MKGMRISACAGVLFFFGALCSSAWTLGPQAAGGDAASAQSTIATSSTTPSGGTVVPRLVQFSGTATDALGKPASGTVTITFSLYELKEGGAPLWSETESVTADSRGHYTAFLGAASPDGLPLDLFTSGAARWLGVAPALPGVGEQPRVLLVGVPYALKAADADTVGGLPPSAFVQASPPSGATGTAGAAGRAGGAASGSAGTAKDGTAQPNTAVSGSGTKDYIPLWTSKTTLGNSVLYQSGTNVGLGTTTPGALLEVNGTSKFDQAVTFASGQTFPGTGTVTSVASGSGLTGGPITGSGTLSVATAGITNAMLQNSSLTVTAGTGLSGGGAVALGGTTTLNLASTSCPAGQALVGLPSSCATFGTGTVTSVGSGSGLTGGPITGSGSLSIATAGVTNAMLQNSSLTVTAGSGLSGGGAVALGGTTTLNLATASCPSGQAATSLPLGCAAFATLGKNTFTGIQTFASGQTFPGTASLGANTFTGIQTFASGQTFPGTAGLGSNTFTGIQTFASGQTFPGTASLGANTFTGIQTFASGQTFPGTAGLGSNTFTGNESVTGNVTATGSVSGDLATFTGSSSGYIATVTQNGSGNAIWGINESDSNGAIGVHGSDEASSGETYGVYGYDASSLGVGVYGKSVGASSTGATYYQGDFSFGVWGDTSASDFGFGVLATADDSNALIAGNNSEDFVTAAFNNYETGSDTAVVLQTVGWGYGGECNIDVSGDLSCNGTVTDVAPVDNGQRRVSLYSMQSPQNWFEDFGSGQLEGGSATIRLEPTFAQTVNTETEYHVFLTPEGDSKGLYVTNKTPLSFEVHEQQGGQSNIAFDYRIVALRKGYEDVRLADKTEQWKRDQAHMPQRRTAPGEKFTPPEPVQRPKPALPVAKVATVARAE